MNDWEMDQELEARNVYVLLKKDYRISRNLRAEWFFKNINNTIRLPTRESLSDGEDILEVISVIPKYPPIDWELNPSNYNYKITPSTLVTYLAWKYRLVFCLDLTPTVAVVDVQRGELLVDEIAINLDKCLDGLTRPFKIQGSCQLFQPQLFVTVVAHVPYLRSETNQVLVQGWVVTRDNFALFLEHVRSQLQELENSLASYMQTTYDKMTNDKFRDGMLALNGEYNGDVQYTFAPFITPDMDFVTLVRYGILSLQLLPENATAGVIVITSGIVSTPDIIATEQLLTQLRGSAISCSFIQLGSLYHPHCCLGYVPYLDFMQFIAAATQGTYFSKAPDLSHALDYKMNCYQEAFYTWGFQRPTSNVKLGTDCSRQSFGSSEWITRNRYFYSHKESPLRRRKHQDSNIHTSLSAMLSCRLREGYMVKNVLLKDNNHLQISMMLLWKHNVILEYVMSSMWPPNATSQSWHYEVIIEGSYDFLHDLAYPLKKFHSGIRTAVIKRFRNLLLGLVHTDQLLVHLHSFANNPIHYTIPESVKNRMPLFTVAQNSNNPLQYTSDCAHPNFVSFWKPVCVLDISVWQKWVHTHRISLILEIDHPLPKNFFLPTMSGRYQNVQCRQAMAAVHTMLTEWSSFVLVENHSYIKFLYSDPDKPPTSFYVIRVTAKAPCMVIRLAFLGGTDGEIRNRTLRQMREKVLSLTFPQRPIVKDTRVRKGLVSNVMDRTDSSSAHKHPLQRGGSQINCCILFTKPLDKILIRYERVPVDYCNLTLPTATGGSLSVPPRSPLGNSKSIPVSTVSTLCRYLHHRRWIWAVESSSEISVIPLEAVARILSTLIKIRINEGFNIAHSHSGMLNIVLEVELKNSVSSTFANDLPVSQDNETRTCIIQYLLFPPHKTIARGSVLSDDGGEAELENGETDGELQLITECWVEPQIGVTSTTDHVSRRGLNYKQIADSFFPRDRECISTMVTFEHLSFLCQKKDQTSSVPFVASPNYVHQPVDAAIQHVPFSFDVIQILPKCHQTEMLFSTYQKDHQPYCSDTNDASNQILMELLYENLATLHDREIYLTPRDNLLFPVQIRQRSNSSLPLPHQVSTAASISEKNVPISPPGDRNRKKSVQECAGKTINWRCFVKGISPTHVFITFIPASFTDVKMLTNSDLGQRLSKHEENREITVMSIDPAIGTERVVLPTDAEMVHSPVRNSHAGLVQPESPTKINNSRAELVVLPIYVYDCPLAMLINQLVNVENGDNIRDISVDMTFKSKELGEDTVTLHSDTPRSSRDSKQPSPEPRSEESYASSKRNQAIQHCDSMKAVFSKCFVVGIFRSLHSNFHIHANDILSVVDDICNESLLEIDITNFIQTVCGHVRDFKVKSALEQLRWTSVPSCSVATDIGLQEGYSDAVKTVKVGDDQIALAPKFPVNLLQSSHCELVQILHNQIRNNFSAILRKSFLPIPSNFDYFFYCLPSFQQSRSKSELMTEKGSIESLDGTEAETDTFKSEVEFRVDPGLAYIRKTSAEMNSVTDQDTNVPTEVTSQISNVSIVDSESVASIVGEGLECNDDAEDDVPPLFIHLMCTVKTKNHVSSHPVRCIPTCLGEIKNCLEQAVGELDLNDVHITLDIICLTLPSEFDSISVGKSMRTTSFCSVSPLPLDAAGSNDETEGLQPSPDDCYQSETQGDQLSHLPEFQHQAVTNSMEEIKWMLRDEIASAMLEFFPLTEKTLDMVASHVQSSPGRPGCVIEEVPLQFVFGPEQSLDKFIMEFKQMALTGYHLSQEGIFHYLAVNRNTSGKRPSDATQRQLQQMAVASKFVLVQTAPHADDGTEIRQMERFSDGNIESEDGLRRPATGGKFGLKEESRSSRHVKPSDDSPLGDDTENEDLVMRSEGNRSKRGRHSPKEGGLSSGNNNEARNLQLLSDARQVLAGEYGGGGLVMSDADAANLPIGLVENKSFEVVDEGLMQKLGYTSGQGSIRQRHPSGPTMSTPGLASDVSSLVGSGQCSNTEDGYDGDSSDVDNDGDWTSDLETQHPSLPKFWLILKVVVDKVFVYFHARDTEENDEKLQLWKDLYQQVIKNILNICKIVNQTLLLQDLHDSRMCNQLLEPETSEDIWKYDDHIFGSRRSYYNSHAYDDSPGDISSEYHDNFLKANLDFMPGAFSCNVVWQTHFMLHSRLKTGPGRAGVSRGIQAMRGVLNTFSVSNRENMFVYAERSGAVFYLRLNESQCPLITQMGASESFSASGSRSSSIAMLHVKRSADGEEDAQIPESRSRINSITDRDHATQDCISVTSKTSAGRQKLEDTIQLLVHGIAEVGPQIKDDLVHVLQKRLDEAVLDIISVTLSRNPMCKLTAEDVQFIQKPKEPPKALIQFTVCPHAQPFLQAMFSYLKQNLLQFLHAPKYIDGKPETHFQDYKPNSVETEALKEGEAFLYNRPPGSGNKGIGLLALSLVDGRQGNPVQFFSCPRPSPLSYQENMDKNEFDMLTSTSKYEPVVNSEKRPGPWNIIQIRIWQQGTLDLDLLTNMLMGAVRHSLWDVGMEYRLLTAPLTEMEAVVGGLAHCSEPATPVKDKKSRTQESVVKKDRAPSPLTLVQVKFREFSSSVPDLINKSRSPVTSPKEPVSAFKLTGGSPVSKASGLLHRDSDVAMEAKGLQRPEPFDQGSKGTLHPVYANTMKDWLDFAVSLGVPTVKKHSLILKFRYSVDFVLVEFQSLVNNLATDTTLRTYRKVVQDGEECYVPHAISQSALKPRERRPDQSPEDSKSTLKSAPGKTNSYILVGRDLKQWKANMGYLYDEPCSEIPSLLAPSLFPTAHRNDTRFPPIVVSNDYYEKNESISCPATAATLPTFTTSISATSGPQSFSTSSTPGRSPEASSTVYIPRQKLLLIIVNDKEIFIYTYNWSAELVSKFQEATKRIVQWNNLRSKLLGSLVNQKLGLFYNGPYIRKRKTKNAKDNLNATEAELFKFTSPPNHDAQPSSYPSRRPSSSRPCFNLGELLRDSQPSRPIHRTPFNHIRDPVLKHGHQMQEMRNADKKEQQKKLNTLLQSSPTHTNAGFTEESLQLLKQASRIEHYCLTPLLFMPHWRCKVAGARDHTINSLPIATIVDPTSRNRNESENSTKVLDRRQSITLPIVHSTQNSPRQLTFHKSNDDAWHMPLCTAYIHEFTQYLQNLGFVSLQMRATGKKDSTEETHTHLGLNLRNNTCFVQKTLIGGSIVVLELSIIEPYFSVRMYSLEGTRIYPERARNHQFMLAFVDECDKLKVVIHLHSFTYDYHLRSIHSYVSGRQLIFRQGYHLTSFLDDFVRYYQKSPNFAWNLIFQDVLTIDNTNTASNMLFDHLLKYDKLYGMHVLRMVPFSQDDREVDNEYVLVELSSRKVSYKDCQENRRTDDFDISLLISQDVTAAELGRESKPYTLFLKYYIVLTSRRELYPRAIMDKKLGKFRTVLTATPIPSRKVSLASMERPDVERAGTPNMISRKTSLTDSERGGLNDDAGSQLEDSFHESSFKAYNVVDSMAGSGPSSPALFLDLRDSASDSESTSVSQIHGISRHRGIRQESVNYLGYFSTTEELMNVIMQEQVALAKIRIHAILETAMIHCKRDSMWNRLVTGGKDGEDSGRRKKEEQSCGLTFADISELLNLVVTQRLDSVDSRLTIFLNMHVTWYQGLGKALMAKYPERHRCFSDANGSTQHVMLVNPNQNRDMMILLSVKPQHNRALLNLVFRTDLPHIEQTFEQPSYHIQALQALVEDFVNVCCFHMWTCVI